MLAKRVIIFTLFLRVYQGTLSFRYLIFSGAIHFIGKGKVNEFNGMG
jgi:hypothetical protein